MNIRYRLIASLSILGLITVACGGDRHKNAASSQDELRDYARYLVEKLNTGQIDSVKNAYPEIINADSIVQITLDTIGVRETSPGEYIVTLTPEVSLTMQRSADGIITVKESKGLFAYPEDKMEMARQTGLWNENLNDVELDSRMKDKGFDEYLSKLTAPAPKASGNILSIGKLKDAGSDSYSVQSVINNSDLAVKGSDYTITVKTNREGRKPTYSTKPGKDIPPHGSVQYHMVFGMDETGDDYFETWDEISKINMKTSPEQPAPVTEKFKGDEYQKYLESKN